MQLGLAKDKIEQHYLATIPEPYPTSAGTPGPRPADALLRGHSYVRHGSSLAGTLTCGIAGSRSTSAAGGYLTSGPAGGRGLDLLDAEPGVTVPVDQLDLGQADGRFHERVVQGITDRPLGGTIPASTNAAV